MAPALMVLSKVSEAPTADVFNLVASGGHTAPWANFGDYMGRMFVGNVIVTFSFILLAIVGDLPFVEIAILRLPFSTIEPR